MLLTLWISVSPGGMLNLIVCMATCIHVYHHDAPFNHCCFWGGVFWMVFSGWNQVEPKPLGYRSGSPTTARLPNWLQLFDDITLPRHIRSIDIASEFLALVFVWLLGQDC